MRRPPVEMTSGDRTMRAIGVFWLVLIATAIAVGLLTGKALLGTAVGGVLAAIVAIALTPED